MNFAAMTHTFGALNRWDWAALATPAILAVMGVIVAVSPPKSTLYRGLWIFAFGLVATLGGLSTAYQIGKDKLENVRSQQAYCYLQPQEPSSYFPGPKWTLWEVNPNDGPIFDVRMSLFERPDRSASNADWGKMLAKRVEINPGTLAHNVYQLADQSILPGAYQVEIQTRYERFDETFEIWPNPRPDARHKWLIHLRVERSSDGKVLRETLPQY